VTIITVTLITVAPMESRMMNREKDRWWLNAIRFAIKLATFKGNIESFKIVNKSKINIVLLAAVVSHCEAHRMNVKPGNEMRRY
jgi:hypothetical protein